MKIRNRCAVVAFALLLEACASPASVSTDVTDTAATSVEQQAPDKRIAMADLRAALITPEDLDGEGWRVSEDDVTIGKADGLQWKPTECGERFTALFDQDLGPPTPTFVTITYEQTKSRNFRVVTENISLWERPIDTDRIAEEFTSLAADCSTLTTDLIALTLNPISLDGAVGFRIEYSTGAFDFNLDIAYAKVGTYLIGITNSGVGTTDAELQSLVTAAVNRLEAGVRDAPALEMSAT